VCSSTADIHAAAEPPSSSTSNATESEESGSSSRPTDSLDSGVSGVRLDPSQPNIAYPENERKEKFQYRWYERWPWLDWNNSLQRVFCHPCSMMSVLRIRLLSKSAQSAFTSVGVNCWHDASRRFNKHEESDAHREAVSKWTSYLANTNVHVQLIDHAAAEQITNRKMLLKILSTIRFLGRQGLAIRGHSNEGNFNELLKIRCDDELKRWLQQKQKYTSHDVQNEYLQLMAHDVLRRLSARIRTAKYFSIIADEVTDQTRQHQLGRPISFRWVDETLTVHEDFVELCLLPKGDAATIVKVILDTLLRFQLPINDCRGQCYDGASVMAGSVSGVSTRIAEMEERAVFVHCLAHSLNLCLQESTRTLPLYRDMIEYVKDVINLIRASPKRSAILAASQSADTVMLKAKQLRPLCPTRWTTRHESIQSLLDNYVCVIDTLEEIASTDKGEQGTKANGLAAALQSFAFFFSLKSAVIVFSRTETLSKALQSKKMTVAASSKAIEQTRTILQKFRQESEWNDLWSSCTQDAQRLNLDQPAVPRKRRPPRRIDDGSQPVQLEPADYFKRQFYELLDIVMSTMTQRLQQPSLNLYANIETSLIAAANGQLSSNDLKDNLTAICEHFNSDLEYRKLYQALEDLPVLVENRQVTSLQDIIDKVVELGPAKRLHAPLIRLLTLHAVIPATSATAERSFSTLRRVKNYLRATMTQQRLNSVLVLHAHQDYTDSIDLLNVARDFVALNENRRCVFGMF